MTADKRSVHTDALDTLGTIIDESQQRDAIHLAVEPVVAGEDLNPGQSVKLVNGEATAVSSGQGVGVVDPFLARFVNRGERFWLVVYPRKITSLRHVWEHPEFPNVTGLAAKIVETQQEASKRWIEEYAATIPLAYSTLMDGADEWLRSKRNGGWGEYLCFGGLLEGENVPDAFWPHYEIVRGTLVPDEHRESFFTCSC